MTTRIVILLIPCFLASELDKSEHLVPSSLRVGDRIAVYSREKSWSNSLGQATHWFAGKIRSIDGKPDLEFEFLRSVFVEFVDPSGQTNSRVLSSLDDGHLGPDYDWNSIASLKLFDVAATTTDLDDTWIELDDLKAPACTPLFKRPITQSGFPRIIREGTTTTARENRWNASMLELTDHPAGIFQIYEKLADIIRDCSVKKIDKFEYIFANFLEHAVHEDAFKASVLARLNPKDYSGSFCSGSGEPKVFNLYNLEAKILESLKEQHFFQRLVAALEKIERLGLYKTRKSFGTLCWLDEESRKALVAKAEARGVELPTWEFSLLRSHIFWRNGEPVTMFEDPGQ